MTANGKVVTNLLITEKDAAAKTKPTSPAPVRLPYPDQTRMATYTTTAQLDGDQGNLRAGKIELRLAKTENMLKGSKADGQVTALVDRRTVTGGHLSCLPGDYTLSLARR